MIRKANIDDVKEIHSLLLFYSKQEVLLGRSLSDLYDQIRDFYVATAEGESRITGACGLHICWDDIAEVRSLAVKKEFLSAGIGRQLVNACIDEARQLGIKKIFVLTYVPDFFKKLGFKPVDKSSLPHKVWADCVNCVKFPDCDEDAMMLTISG